MSIYNEDKSKQNCSKIAVAYLPLPIQFTLCCRNIHLDLVIHKKANIYGIRTCLCALVAIATICSFVEFDRRFLLTEFLQSDWKERVRMRPVVTLPAHGVVCVCYHIFFIFMLRSRSLLFIALFPQLFHAIRFPSVFLSFFISDCMFFTVASQHLPVFCRFHLILHTFLFSPLPPVFPLYDDLLHIRATSKFIFNKKNCKTKKYVDASVIS